MSTTTQHLRDELAAFERTSGGAILQLRLSLADIILRGLDAKGWSQSTLAKVSGVPADIIEIIVHADCDCTLEIAGKLLHALGCRATFEPQ